MWSINVSLVVAFSLEIFLIYHRSLKQTVSNDYETVKCTMKLKLFSIIQLVILRQHNLPLWRKTSHYLFYPNKKKPYIKCHEHKINVRAKKNPKERTRKKELNRITKYFIALFNTRASKSFFFISDNICFSVSFLLAEVCGTFHWVFISRG